MVETTETRDDGATTRGPNTHWYRDAHFITNWTVVRLNDPDGVTHYFEVPTRILEAERALTTVDAGLRSTSRDSEVREAIEALAADLVQDHRGIPYDVIERLDKIAAILDTHSSETAPTEACGDRSWDSRYICTGPKHRHTYDFDPTDREAGAPATDATERGTTRQDPAPQGGTPLGSSPASEAAPTPEEKP